MNLAYDFLGIGGLATDLALTVDHLPLDDGKVSASLIGYQPGGFVANATCAAAHLGLRTAYAGWVGDDAPGALLRQDFERWSVDPLGLVAVSGAVTPFTVVITDRQGQRCILLPDNPLFHLDLTPAQRDLAARARMIYSFPRDRAWCDDLHAIAKGSGGLLALDIEITDGLHPDDLRRAIDQAGIVFISASGLALLGLGSIGALAGSGRWVIQTDGARGAYGIAGQGTEPVFVPAYRVPHVVDTTGAGDIFHAALITAYLDGAALPGALEFAAAAAALKVQHQGARGGLPTRAAIAGLMQRST